jgi:3D (Asp-Asp-Asp) domain-containing protein
MKRFMYVLIVVLAMGVSSAEGKEVKVKLKVTAYCEYKQPTASGIMPSKETVAFPPKLIKKLRLRYGQLIHIENIGYRRFQDKMHHRWTDRCDIWNKSRNWCLSFGKRELTVTVFKE